MQGLQGQLQFQLVQDLTINQKNPNKQINKAHLNSIQCMAAHPDNKHFASGSHDHTIKLWDMEKTKEVMQLSDHKQGVWSLQYSKDGNQILSGSPDTTVQIWDSKKGSVGSRLKGHKDKVYDAKFNHSNRNIASCGVGGEILIWDTSSTSKPIKTINIPQQFAYHIEWTKNDELIFLTTWQSKFYTFDAKTFEQLNCETVTNRLDSKCQSCTTNFDVFPGRVFVGTDRGTICWYEYSSQTKKTKKEIQFTAHMDQTRYVLLHPNKKILASTSRDGSVRLWNCSNQGRPKITHNLVHHSQKVSEAIWMEDWIITGSWDQSIAMWNTSDFLGK